MRIILASASPRRKELMSLITKDFEIIPADIEEVIPENVQPVHSAGYLARLKAEHILNKCPDGIVIGCDTIVYCGGEVMGKPRDKADAERMLKKLSGSTHRVITGCCICQSEGTDRRTILFEETTEVEFYPLSQKEIEEYIATGEPMDKAGAYGIQGLGGLFVKRIKGCYNNVVGLPVSRLKRELNKLMDSCQLTIDN